MESLSVVKFLILVSSLLVVHVPGSCSQPTGCSLHLAIGLDVLDYVKSDLPGHLESLLRTIFALRNTSCTNLKLSLTIQTVGKDGQSLFEAQLQDYQDGTLRELRKALTRKRSYLNEAFLGSFLAPISSVEAKGKVLLLFTDGLDEDLPKLQDMSTILRQEGWFDALMTVAVNNATDVQQIKQIEFGRRARHGIQLSLDMPQINSVLAQELLAVTERLCCHECFCTCVGQAGQKGPRGILGKKGRSGRRGPPGEPGHYGSSGDQGPLGLPGSRGDEGCTGPSGFKGLKGFSGEQGEMGLRGYDGVNGDKGDSGVLGQPGSRGYSGKQGRKGPPGDRGVKGPSGVRGDSGNPGRRGSAPGPRGVKGDNGTQGEPGPEGNRGEPGQQGPPGDTGTCHKGAQGVQGAEGQIGRTGPTGPQGVGGEQGIRGPIGITGVRGPPGARGVQGSYGSSGSVGDVGGPGPKGMKGEAGDIGEKGDSGPAGPQGATGEPGCDHKGPHGGKGRQGWKGVRGEPGMQGGRGSGGIRGSKGLNGFQGREGVPGESGITGERGTPGPTGEEGPTGLRGTAQLKPCELTALVRKHCACCGKDADGAPLCPRYPTELVFVLEMSTTVTPDLFARMKAMVAALVQDLHISHSSCPAGARVAVLVYAHTSNYRIRFQDFNGRQELLRAVYGLIQARSAQRGRLGAAMRFVARNVFKRARPALLGRKVVLFFTSGDSQAVDGIDKAVLQMEALGIIPIVVSFRPLPEVEKALEVNGMFQYIQLPVNDDSQDIEKLQDPVSRCTICFDFCQPGDCMNRTVPNPLRLRMDLALLVDTSNSLSYSNTQMVSGFLSAVLDGLKISTHPEQPENTTRVSLLHSGPQSWAVRLQTPYDESSSEDGPSEFSFTHYSFRQDMQQHLQRSLWSHPPMLPLAHAMEWAVMRGFPLDHKGRLRGILAVLTGATRTLDPEKLVTFAKLVACRSIVLFVLALGPGDISDDLEVALDGMGIVPWKYHVLQLAAPQKPEMEYARRAAMGFFRRVLVETSNEPWEPTDNDCNIQPAVPVYGTASPALLSPAGAVDPNYVPSSPEYLPGFGTALLMDMETAESSPAPTPLESTPSTTNFLSADATPDASTNGPMAVASEKSTTLLPDMTSGTSVLSQTITTIRTPQDATTSTRNPPETSTGTQKPRYTLPITHPTPSAVGLPGTGPDVEIASEELCSLPKDAGTSCADYSLMWYHEKSQSICVRFWYRGCGGNTNRFQTEQECLNACIVKHEQGEYPREDNISSSDVCAEQRDAGPCRSFLAQWFFNSTSIRCERFWYGGCGGNGNRFESQKHCESTCTTPLQHAQPVRHHAEAWRNE